MASDCSSAVWEAGRKKKHSHFILLFNEGQTHCNTKGKTSDILLLLLIQTQEIWLKSLLSQYAWPHRLFPPENQIKGRAALAKVCFLTEEHTFFNIY